MKKCKSDSVRGGVFRGLSGSEKEFFRCFLKKSASIFYFYESFSFLVCLNEISLENQEKRVYLTALDP